MARDFSAELFGSPTSGQGTDFSKELFGSKPKERTYGEAFTDVGAGVVSGIGSLVQLPGQLYGLATGDFEDTGLLGLGKSIKKSGEEMKSDVLKQREEQRAQKIAEAEQKGTFEAFKTAFGETVKDPALVTSFLAEQVPQLLVPFGAGKVGSAVVAGRQALAGATAKEAALAGGKAGVTTAIGAGGVQQGADIGAQSYEDIYKYLVKDGMSPDQAKSEALNLARASGAGAFVISLLAQRLPGAKTLEESFVGVPGVGGKVARIGKGIAGETGSEIFEEGGGKIGQNIAMRQVNPEQALMEGVGATAGLAAVGGIGMGGLGGALQKGPQPTTITPPETKQTTDKLLNQSQLLLPAPDEQIINDKQYDPLRNPLGNFLEGELTPEQIAYINKDRSDNNKPRLNSYSLEDYVDALRHSSDTDVAKQGALDNILTFKTGYDGMVETTVDQVLNAALDKNIETGTQGFKDFLTRATGTDNLEVMSPVQLYSAYEALVSPNVPRSDTLQILPEGTNATRFTQKQYDQALNNLQAEYNFLDTDSLGRTSVINDIKDTTGLKDDTDAKALLRHAINRGDLEERISTAKVDGKDVNVVNISFAGKSEPLPSGFDIRFQTFKQGSVPENYEIKNGSVVLDRVGTEEEAKIALEKQTAIAEKKALDLEKDIEKIQSGVDRLEYSLDEKKTLGHFGTPAYNRMATDIGAQIRQAKDRIDAKLNDIRNLRNPFAIVPVGEKPVTAKKYVFYDNDTPLASFANKDLAEQYGLMRQNAKGEYAVTDETLQQIIDSAPTTKGTLPKRYASYAKKELARRKGEAPEGIEVRKSMYQPKVEEDFEKIRQNLLPALKKFGLEKVGLRIVKSIADGKADGSYVQELIKIAYNAKNPMGTLRHEVIHALKELGAFTQQEWKILENKAKSEWIDKYIKKVGTYKAYQDAYKQSNGDLKGFDEYIAEEAIAEAFRDFANTKPPVGLIGNLFFRLNKMFEALGNTFKRLGYATAGDIFQRVERGETKPTRAAVSTEEKFKPPQEERFQVLTEEPPDEPRKIGKRIVGSPPNATTEQARTALVKRMVNILEHPYAMFGKSKDWYERSGGTIREISRGDKKLMEKVVRLTSIYSQANSLGGNITAVVKSLKQIAEGYPSPIAGRFPATTSKNLPAILSAKEFNTDLQGVEDKLMNFYRNLHDAAFQEDTFNDASTIDRWMMRLFGYPHIDDEQDGGSNAVSTTQYKYAKDLIVRITNAYNKKTGENLLPRQIQAGLWTYVKNDTEFNKAKEKAKEKGKPVKFEPMATDFADYLNRATVNITWESRPSTKLPLLEGIHDAPRQAQEAFNRAVRKIFETDSGENKIFQLLNNAVLYNSQESIGAYEDKIVPNVVTRVVLSQDDIKANLAGFTNMADQVSAIIGYVTKQDAVAWYRPDPTAKGKSASKGFKVTPNQELTVDLENKIFEHLNTAMPGIGFTRVNNSLDFINFRGDDGKPFLMPDKDYDKKLVNALETFSSDVNFNVDEFRAVSGYIYNDWEKDANGQGYLERFSSRELANIRTTINGWSKAYDNIAEEYGTEYGWSRPPEPSVRPSSTSGEGVTLGRKQEYALSYEAVHYSNAEREFLDGDKYGTGIRGAEASRLQSVDDPLIKNRTYFYIPHDELGGRYLPPEGGLGKFKHTQKFDNILGPGIEMRRILDDTYYKTRDDAGYNRFETAVIDSGYDGYALPNMGMMVILNHNDIPVNPENKEGGLEKGERQQIRAPETKEFKQWFGDSEVVDNDGNPLVMYHGTYDDFTVPKINFGDNEYYQFGFHVGNSEQASKRIADLNSPDNFSSIKNKSPNIMPFYVQAKNPLRLDENRTGRWGIDDIMKAVIEKAESQGIDGITQEMINDYYNDQFDIEEITGATEVGSVNYDPDKQERFWADDYGWKSGEKSSYLKTFLEQLGYDSIVYANEYEGGGDSYILLSPNQVKSAFNQKPTKSKDVRYQIRAPETEEFQEWIGDSVAIDKNGEPIVFYHGTNQDLKEFRPSKEGVLGKGIYITPDAEYASSYAEESAFGDKRGTGGNVIPLFARVTYPLIVKYKQGYDPAIQALEALGVDTDKAYQIVEKSQEEFGNMTNQIMSRAKKLGYDAIFYNNEDGSIREAVVFEPNQVKSAFNQKPTASKDIRYQIRNIMDEVDPDINSRVGATTRVREEKGFVERLVDAISPTSFAKYRQAFVNKYEAIELLSRQVAREHGSDRLLANTSAIAAALQSDRAAGVAAASFKQGIPVYRDGFFTVDPDTKGLIPILEPLMAYNDPYIFQLFQYYGATRRGKRLDAEGRERTFTKEDVAYGDKLEKQFPEFKQVFNEYQTYNKGLVDLMVDRGVITKEEGRIWTQNWDYIPFYRQMDGETTAGPKVFSSFTAVAKPKELKGAGYYSVLDANGQEIGKYLDPIIAQKKADEANGTVEQVGAPITDFLETVVRNARAAIEASMKNEAGNRIIRDTLEMGLAQEVPLGTNDSAREIVTIKQNGKNKYFRVADPLLYEALKGLNTPQMQWLSWLAAPANLLRNFVTKDPGFMIANLGRDSLQAWITSGTDMRPVIDTFKQFSKTLTNSSPEAQALALAGLTGYDFSGDVKGTSKGVAKELRKMAGQKTKLESLTTFWDMLEQGSHASDMATRAEVYKRTLERTKSPKYPNGNEAEAFYQAMEVLNFSRKGNSAIIQIVSAVVPFFNARVQGLDVLYRSGWGKMATENADVQKKAFANRALIMMGLSMAYWFMMTDSDEYKKLSKEERDNYWIIPALSINDKPFRFPIPFELGVVFKVLPERVLEAMFGNDTGKDLRESIFRNMTNTLQFNPIPQAFIPIVENVTNHSFFTGENIVGRGMEDLAPQFQYTQSTSQLAKDIGATFGSSPIKIENLIRGYTGTMGTYALQMLDAVYRTQGDDVRASMRLEQMPVIKRFFSGDSGTISAYYDLKQEVNTVIRTLNLLEKSGDIDAYMDYMKENGSLYNMRGYINTIDKNMKQVREARKYVNDTKGLSPDEKREQLDSLHDIEISLTENIKQLRKEYR